MPAAPHLHTHRDLAAGVGGLSSRGLVLSRVKQSKAPGALLGKSPAAEAPWGTLPPPKQAGGKRGRERLTCSLHVPGKPVGWP